LKFFICSQTGASMAIIESIYTQTNCISLALGQLSDSFLFGIVPNKYPESCKRQHTLFKKSLRNMSKPVESADRTKFGVVKTDLLDMGASR